MLQLSSSVRLGTLGKQYLDHARVCGSHQYTLTSSWYTTDCPLVIQSLLDGELRDRTWRYARRWSQYNPRTNRAVYQSWLELIPRRIDDLQERTNY